MAKALGTGQDGLDIRAGMGDIFCQEPELGGDEIEGVRMVKLYFPAFTWEAVMMDAPSDRRDRYRFRLPVNARLP